jgi:hypothetical protein
MPRPGSRISISVPHRMQRMCSSPSLMSANLSVDHGTAVNRLTMHSVCA